MPLQPLPQLYFGPTLETVLDLPYPLDNLVTYTEPRHSSTEQFPSGVEDSWYHGTDYCLEGDARWLPYGPINPGFQQTQPLSTWEQFLAYGRQRNARVRYVPNRALPTNYVDGWLVAPFDAGPGGTEKDGTNKLHLKLRSKDRHYGLAQRGLFYEYAPGASLSDPLTYTFARSSAGLYIGPDGLLHVDAAGVLSDRHYLSGLQTTLLQAAATNKLTAPEDLSNAAWTPGYQGVTVPTINNTSPRGDGTASFVREDTSNGLHRISQGYTRSAAGNPQGVTVFLKTVGSRTMANLVLNAGGVTVLSLQVTLTGSGTITSIGTATPVFFTITALANGWYAASYYGTPTASTTCSWEVRLYNGGESYVGDGASGMYVWGCVATDNTLAGVYWGTGASRSPDNLSVPWPYKPQAGWFYVKLIELGMALATTGGYPSLIAVGNAAGATPIMRFFSEKTNGQATYGFTYWNTVNAECNPATGPNIGDTVEVLGIIFADGSTQIRLSINGGVEIVNTNLTTQPFAAAWSGATLWLCSPSGATSNAGIVSVKAGPGGVVNTMALARAA